MIYNLGVRKFVVFNVGFLGCIFLCLVLGSIDGLCVVVDNELVVSFNMVLKFFILEFIWILLEFIFLYGNFYDVVYDFIFDFFFVGNGL